MDADIKKERKPDAENFVCKIAASKKEIIQALLLRRKVLVKEFHYSRYKDEPDKYDINAVIYVVKDRDKVVGTVRVRKESKGNAEEVSRRDVVYRIQRVAIDEKYRMTGVGSMLLQKAAKDFGKLCVMAPQETVSFYERYGFKKTGEVREGKFHAYYRMQNF
ncbi:MAG: GNAT family N-acetyltransferase [Nanoarchaeota archaeon]